MIDAGAGVMVIVVGVRVVVVHGHVTAVLSPPPHEVVAIVAACVPADKKHTCRGIGSSCGSAGHADDCAGWCMQGRVCIQRTCNNS